METTSIDFLDWLERKAQKAERIGDHREAISYWSRLLAALTHAERKDSPDVTRLAQIHYHLGMCHQAVNEHTKCIYHLKYSVRLNANEPRYYEAFGRANLRGGHWQIALTQFERAAKLQPTNASVLRQYSWVLLMMGRRHEARLYAKKARDLAPADPRTHWCLARVYRESRMYAHALASLRKIKGDEKYGSRARLAMEKMELELGRSFDGLTLRILRQRMKLDGAPFHMQHYRFCENLWLSFTLAESPYDFSTRPESWAAGLAWVCQDYVHTEGKLSWEQLIERFHLSSMQLWPAIYRIEEFLKVGSSFKAYDQH